MKTGVVLDKRYADHEMGPQHVESPLRVEVLNHMLGENPPFPFLTLAPRPASESEIAWVHEPSYIEFLKATAAEDRVFIDPDTATNAKTYETALLAAGGLLNGIDAVMDGRVENAFAVVRPPGHHAEAARAMGFCFFNNAAVGAEYLLRRHGLKRVLIVDFDVHHGNGTQHHFYSRPDVLYFSTHRVPFYPGTGAVTELGSGPGRGFNLNVPLAPGKSDDDFLFIFQKILAPVVSRYEPQFIIASAGYDIGAGDPLGGMSVTRQGFGGLAASVRLMAEEVCSGRLACVLEGGYNLKTLKEGVEETLIRLSSEAIPALPEPSASEATSKDLGPCFRLFGEFWPLEP